MASVLSEPVAVRQPTRPVVPQTTLVLLGLSLLAAALLALLLGDLVRGEPGTRLFSFTLDHAARQVGAMVLVAAAVGASTVAFQTITANRILTPSLLGMDAIHLLVRTAIILVAGQSSLGVVGQAALSGAAMVAITCGLYGWLMVRWRVPLDLLLLIGLVVAAVVRSGQGYLVRIMDPTSHLSVQQAMFASFTAVDARLLAVAAVVVTACLTALVAWRHRLDVMLLGRDDAVGLGVDHDRMTIVVLVVCAVLMSVSTALVGPVAFFGLVVSNAAYALVGRRHGAALPAAVLLGVIALVGGQWVLRTISLEASLSVVIELAGGVVFLVLLLSGKDRS